MWSVVHNPNLTSRRLKMRLENRRHRHQRNGPTAFTDPAIAAGTARDHGADRGCRAVRAPAPTLRRRQGRDLQRHRRQAWRVSAASPAPSSASSRVKLVRVVEAARARPRARAVAAGPEQAVRGDAEARHAARGRPEDQPQESGHAVLAGVAGPRRGQARERLATVWKLKAGARFEAHPRAAGRVRGRPAGRGEEVRQARRAAAAPATAT